MTITLQLQNRSNQVCELCSLPDDNLQAYTVPPKTDDVADNQVVLCDVCYGQISSKDFSNAHHWRCLEGSIWNEVPSVQVLSYKILSKLPAEGWAQNAMESAYLDEALIEWANAEDVIEAEKVIHKDSYGVVLQAGDTVILTENLNVKGTNYIAPKGTVVRKIRLVSDNGEQVEGKINGDTIVILTKFIRRTV